MNKVNTDDNLADAPTMGFDAPAIQKHAEGDRHEILPQLGEKVQGAESKVGDERGLCKIRAGRELPQH